MMKWRYLVVVSQDAYVVRWVGARIGAMGWKYIAAKDEDQAMACLGQTEVDGILLTDEGLDTAEVVGICAAFHDRIPCVPIIVLTEHPVADDALCLRIAGAHAVLDRGSFQARTLESALLGSPGGADPDEGTCGFSLEWVRSRLERATAGRTPPASLIEIVRASDADAEGIGPAEIRSVLEEDRAFSERALGMIRHVLDPLAPPDDATIDDLLPLIPPDRIREILIPCLLFDYVSPWSLATDLLGLALHAMGCALAAKVLAPFARGADPHRAFGASLLHDVGISLLVRAIPGAYERVIAVARQDDLDLGAAERRILGTMSHDEAAVRAFEVWGFPAEFEQAARAAHTPNGSPATELGRLHKAAHAIAEGLHLTLRIREASSASTVAEILGVGEAALAGATAGLREEAIRSASLFARVLRSDYAAPR